MNKYRLTRILICGTIMLTGAVHVNITAAESILNSKHNLSVTGSGTIKAATETQVCIFCHTPHNSSSLAPLWNRFDTGQIYTPYDSTTVKATIGQPTGDSKLCLSCHDGTVALGMVRSRTSNIIFTAGVSVMPDVRSNLGTDLSNDHPISFDYDALLTAQNAELNDPSTLTGNVTLDKNGQLQCTSCHDPHDNQHGMFLRMDGVSSGLCNQCHNINGWTGSPHGSAVDTWNSSLPDPWPNTDWTTVAENGCQNCHSLHDAGGERLLNNITEEDNCLSCHNGNVASLDITIAGTTMAHIGTRDAGVHDPTESAEVPLGTRHVECVDCHDPHEANDQDVGGLPGSIAQVKGVNASGIEIAKISFEYELCFRCHADTSNTSGAYINRQFPETNTRLEFDPSNLSYHPVEAAGKNPDVPSLISPWTTSSLTACSDCHNNSFGPNNNGAGPNGPHGSAYPPLLERQFNFVDDVSENTSLYALCYKCHDRNNIMDNVSFGRHSNHINQTPCSTCHDPHASSGYPHLLNFDLDLVFPNRNGLLDYSDTGLFQGTCSMNCHNHNHRSSSY